MANKYYYNEITILKALATLMITWYHFKWSVPEHFAPLFIGGAFGNSLFFFCSGYLLKFDDEKYFGQWIVKKYFRVMPAVWIAYFIFAGGNFFRGISPIAIDLINCFWPTKYWFICNIFVYFLIVWLLRPIFTNNKKSQMFNIKILMIAVGIVQLAWYFSFCEYDVVNIDEGYLKAWYFLGFFLWGYYSKISESMRVSNKYAYFHVIMAVVLFFFYKKVSEVIPTFACFQVIFIPLILIYVIYSLRVVSAKVIEYDLPEWCKKLMVFLSGLTLEIYIVQMYFIDWIMPNFLFPVNILFSFVAILVVAFVVNKIATYVYNKMYFNVK